MQRGPQRLPRSKPPLTAYAARRKTMIDRTIDPALEVPPLPASLCTIVTADIEKLDAEAGQLEATATHAAALDADRNRIAELKDRSKLHDDLATVLHRAEELRDLAGDQGLPNTGPNPNHITPDQRTQAQARHGKPSVAHPG